ncbi:MAG: HD-GYP domain-containing protein [Giesbergeria sp.]
MLASEEEPKGVQANPVALNAIMRASEKHLIVASEDILDARGFKLWAKGQPVSVGLQQKLLERTLQRPLEACLTAQDGATLAFLQERLEEFLVGQTTLARGLAPWADKLREHMQGLHLHSVAQLLFTTALVTRTSFIAHAVAAAALMGAMALSKNWSAVDIRSAMLAGLLHDIGEVYIQPEYLDSSDPLDLLGHKHLAVHPRMAQMLLTSTTDYSPAVCRAVGEHHERLDGSGYPARLHSSQISELGKMLSVVEVTLGISRAKSAPMKRTSFALRLIPGEFDLRYASFVCNMANGADEEVPQADPSSPAVNILNPIERIKERMDDVAQLHRELVRQKSAASSMAIVEGATARLSRLQTAWNSLGSWGASASDLSGEERFEVNMADRELDQRMRELQRECLLLAMRLPLNERGLLAPLWRELQVDDA